MRGKWNKTKSKHHLTSTLDIGREVEINGGRNTRLGTVEGDERILESEVM